jgi:hypothetical protein
MENNEEFALTSVAQRFACRDGMNCLEYKLWLILHDPVSALVRQRMTALRQTFGDEHVLFAPIWRCGLRGDYNYGLSAQIVQLRDAPCGSRKILKLARNGVTEFLLNPKD